MSVTSITAQIDALRTSTGVNSITPEILASIFSSLVAEINALDATGLGTSVQNAIQKAETAVTQANSAMAKATSAETAATNAGSVARTASDAVNVLNPKVSAALDALAELQTIITVLSDSVGKPNGIAPLDEQGLIPSSHLPSYVDDVVEFVDILEVTPPLNDVAPVNIGEVYFCSDSNIFVFLDATTKLYYADWDDRNKYESSDCKPLSGKIYVATKTNKTYRWSGSQLTFMGSSLALGETPQSAFPGNRGKQLEEEISSLSDKVALHVSSFVNANLLLGHQHPYTDLLSVVASVIDNKGVYFFYNGMVLTFYANTGWESWQYTGVSGLSSQILNPDYWRKFGGSAVVGNCYNVTAEHPLDDGLYHTFSTAVVKAYEAGVALRGLQITYAVAGNSWKTYQYVGTSTEREAFVNPLNWIDLAGLSAGTEAVLNIESLCGLCTAENPDFPGYYTLTHALNALYSLQQRSGITYAKPGLIITYPISQYVWETKQFGGNASDITDNTLWKDFGSASGGSDVEVSDIPEEESKKAFSAGGAYNTLPVDIAIDNTESGVAKIHLVNERGEMIGNEQRIIVGTGSGGSGGTVIAIAFSNAPLAGALGSPLILNTAIRSTTISGGIESDNSIERIEIIDRSTNLVVSSMLVNKPSSSDMEDFSFEIDFTSLFTSAESRRYQILVTDDGGNTQSKNVTVTAVDVTISSSQVLGYDANYTITPTTSSVQPPLFKFGNNVSAQGIHAYVDMFIGNTWQNIYASIVFNQYSQNVLIQPQKLGLKHGAYPIRMYGIDVASEAKGNTIYSTLLCVEPGNNTPLVAIRYNDKNRGRVNLYENISVDVAAYSATSIETPVSVSINDRVISSIVAHRTSSYNVVQQVQGYSMYDTLSIYASTAETSTKYIDLVVFGSAINASLKEGAAYSFDFSTRNNAEPNHSITSGSYTITPKGANWRTNGFVPFLGEQTFRVAENMTATLNHTPFSSPNIETTGYAVQFAFASKNIIDDNAMLLHCYDGSGAGFYVTGSHVGIYCKGGEKEREERAYRQGEKVTVAVVVEPASLSISRSGVNYSTIKLYLNGELCACIGYTPERSMLNQNVNISFDGRFGDIYLFYLLGWNDYFLWAQAFDNYLTKLTDTSAMVTEFDFENVIISQEGDSRPSCDEIYAKGMAYIVEAPYAGSQIDALDNTTSTSENNYITLYYFNPARPWTNFKATSVRSRNQGTTSAKRPVKNKRYYLAKSKGQNKDTVITLLNPDDTTMAGRRAIELAKINKVQVGESTIPVDIITVKIDYSDSTNANDCGICEMMSETINALGSQYQTPVQRAYTGVFQQNDVNITGLKLNHSTANHSVATFRCNDENLLNSPIYFHAKGNWKEDKGEQVALGFKDTPGYNLGCLNYGDFIEFFGTRDETLDDIEARFKTAPDLDLDAVYLLSLYCGADYRFMRYNGSDWASTTGSMKQVNGQWVVTGDVLNPVDGFELLNYQGMCWWQGVASIDDMMAMKKDVSSWCQKLVSGGDISATEFPAWTYYFECMIDDDQLAIDYALGKKVPTNLYRLLQFLGSCDYSIVDNWQEIWCENMYRYMSPYSVFCYDVATDYNGMLDQRAKNMQPMWFLEEGFEVVNGHYSSPDALKMYLNKIYDSDGANGKDNDGGCTFDPETDPNVLSPNNPYAGYGSVLFNNIYLCPEVRIDAAGNTISLQTVAAAMRNVQTSIDGKTIKPFSPEGAMYVFYEKRLLAWQKKVSSYDGIRKYISYSATSDALYFYALQGLGLTSLPSFIDKRWRYRDGFYRTGNFFSGILSGRISAVSQDAKIRFTAAKSGYFGIGNDSSGSLSESVFLEAGETAEFTNFSKVEGALIYIYQADRMATLDLSELSLSDTFNFSVLSLCSELALGAAIHQEKPIGSFSPLKTLSLGEMPFLQSLDVRNTSITSINAPLCPRLESVNAEDTALTLITLAETSPVRELRLPNTMTDIRLISLPELTYDGVSNKNYPAVTRINIESSPELDAAKLLKDILFSQQGNLSLDQVRIIGMPLKGDATELLAIIEAGVGGTTLDGVRQDKPVINAEYSLTRLYESYQIEEIESAIDGITLSTSVDAYITCINEVNDEFFGGVEEVGNVTLDNIDEHLLYYNGETADDAIATFVNENVDINTLV